MDDMVRDGLTVRDVLKDVVSVPAKENRYAFGYVGYCYSKAAKDVVFFLPKVVLTGEVSRTKKTVTIRYSERHLRKSLTLNRTK